MLKSVIFLTLILQSLAFAESSFDQGLEAFQKGDLDSSQRIFQSHLNDPKLRFAALYNLGTVAARMKKPGEALGYFRKALNLKPRDKDLRHNLALVMEQFKIQPPSGNISTFEVIKTEFLNGFSFGELAFASVLLLIFSLVSFVSFYKKYLTDEERPFPPARLFILTAVFALSFVLVLMKAVDTYTELATVIVPKAELKSGPDNSTATLAEVGEGVEVQVNQTHSDNSGTWKQVTIPGNLTGWVSDKSVMVTSGEGPW